jgi:hypothetical protein
VQRLVVGLVETVLPFADPQTPGVGVGVEAVLFAEQFLLVPLFIPLQTHVHGPEPLTVDAIPALQRFVVGLVETVLPFAEPQTASTLS